MTRRIAIALYVLAAVVLADIAVRAMPSQTVTMAGMRSIELLYRVVTNELINR